MHFLQFLQPVQLKLQIKKMKFEKLKIYYLIN
jgi:hypothetical protein